MGDLDLTAAIDLAAEAAHDEGCGCSQGVDPFYIRQATAAVTAAVALIEADVRAEVAADIEDYTDAVLGLVDTQNGARLAFIEIVRIAKDGRW